MRLPLRVFTYWCASFRNSVIHHPSHSTTLLHFRSHNPKRIARNCDIDYAFIIRQRSEKMQEKITFYTKMAVKTRNLSGLSCDTCRDCFQIRLSYSKNRLTGRLHLPFDGTAAGCADIANCLKEQAKPWVRPWNFFCKRSIPRMTHAIRGVICRFQRNPVCKKGGSIFRVNITNHAGRKGGNKLRLIALFA